MNQVAWTFTALTLTAACHAYAQTGVPAEFPRKTIRLVATSSPGSPVDLFARAISDHLAKSFAQSVVIDNRGGAGGTLAAGIVLQAEADGHVMMVNTSAQVVAPFMYRKLPFDMLRDFAAIAPLAIQPNVLVISPQHGWKSVQELVAAAKAKPKGLSYGTGGSGTGTHMNAERFRLRAGIDAVQVPYKGSPEALVDVIAGRIDWSFLPVSTALAHMNDGRVRALALSGDRRSPKLPDLPTITESGLPDSDFPFWVGVFVLDASANRSRHGNSRPPPWPRRLSQGHRHEAFRMDFRHRRLSRPVGLRLRDDLAANPRGPCGAVGG